MMHDCKYDIEVWWPSVALSTWGWSLSVDIQLWDIIILMLREISYFACYIVRLTLRLHWSTLFWHLARWQSCWGIQVYHRQAPVSYECHCWCRQWHAEVRSWTHPSTARRAALAGRSRAGAVHYKLCATVQRCLQNKAPLYMKDCCVHTSDIARW